MVEIRLRDGQVLREFVYAPRGEPSTMLTAQELRAKFSLLVSEALGSRGEEALFNAIEAMDQNNPIASLFVAPA